MVRGLQLFFLSFILSAHIVVADQCIDTSGSSLGRLINDVKNITMPETIDELRELGEKGRFKGKGKYDLGYMNFINPNAKGTIVLMQGYTENYEKWMDSILDLYRKGYSVYTYDQRGMGVSGRLGNIKDVVHVDKFTDYVRDMEKFMKKVVKPKKHENLFLMGHSMGSTIATAYLEKHQDVFKAAVLSSPMYAPKVSVIPGPVTWTVAKTACMFGKCKDSAIGQTRFNPDESWEKDFERSKATHNTESFKRYREYKIENPEIVSSRASNGWVKENLEGCVQVRLGARKLKTPIKMFQAGDDHYVHNWGQSIVCRRAKNCDIERFDNSYHEIFNETDDIRGRAVDTTDTYFSSYM